MHPLQSLEWEKARKQMGIETIRIDNYLITLHKVFKNLKIGYLPRSNIPPNKTINKFYLFGKKNNIFFIKIEPYIEANSKIKIQNPKIIKSSHPLFPEWTQILDLKKTEENLLKSFHPKTRYNIKLAIKKGVIVKEKSNNQGFETFIKLYFETCKRQKYLGHNYQYHKTIWNNFKNNIAHILIAYYNNTPIAAYQLWYMDKIIYYVYGGTSTLYRTVMASNLLMWEAIKLGKKLGAEKFDMWGSLSPNYSLKHPWAGFTRFKQGYGTRFVRMIGSYDLIINPFLYQIYTYIYPIRQFILRFIT